MPGDIMSALFSYSNNALMHCYYTIVNNYSTIVIVLIDLTTICTFKILNAQIVVKYNALMH